jgi:predicted ATP-grasp superfamily ATP-dependent carboligase
VHAIDPKLGWLESFVEVLDQVDGALVIAPEFNHILESLVRSVEARNKLHLGCASRATRLATDKLTCGRHWLARAIQTPTPCAVTEASNPIEPPVVLKPRDGAGSLGTILVSRPQDWPLAWEQVQAENPGSDWLAMPYVAGQPASVACIVGRDAILTLPPAAQHLTSDGRFRYLGGELPLPPALSTRAQSLAHRACATVDGLRGYVGVDLVLGGADDGSQDWAIEINPRLTTSYLGLQTLCQQNLLAAMVAACTDQPLPDLSWHSGTVRFQADGKISRT